jgi:flagellar basal-body rod protein FlgB
MHAMAEKMRWLEARQKVLAQNIANADTPNYKPMDLKAFDFKNLLKSSTSAHAVGLGATNPGHVSSGTSGTDADIAEKRQKKVYETAPAGNAVILEEQLLKMNETMMDHRMISTLYQKNIDLIKSSIRSQ